MSEPTKHIHSKDCYYSITFCLFNVPLCFSAAKEALRSMQGKAS